MKKKNYRKIAKFYYKNEHYQMFYDDNNKAAFLLIDDNGNYHYPEIEKVIEINFYLRRHNDGMDIVEDKVQKYRFLPKVRFAGAVTLLTAALLTGCGKSDSVLPSHGGVNRLEPGYQTTVVEENEDKTVLPNVEESSASTTNTNEKTPEEINEKYLALLSPADDEFDFKYANDFEYLSFTNRYRVRDAKGYQEIFGYSNVSIDKIEEALKQNPNISQTYKDFILQYVKDWKALWPDSDFSNLYHNLFTLQIHEISRREMTLKGLSSNVAAEYLRSENAIYVLDDIDLSKGSNDYIIFAHELTHAARNATYKEGNTKVNIGFYSDYNMGNYADEALITNFVYQMQGLGMRSNKYTLQCSYYRIILDCIDYDASDYMNHSVNYLIEKMDEFMGDEQYAYHIVSLIDAEAMLHYTDYMKVDFDEFSELYSYITRMYCKKYLKAGMSQDEANAVYNNLIGEVTYYFDKMANPYDLNMDVFESTFKECANELGISVARGR